MFRSQPFAAVCAGCLVRATANHALSPWRHEGGKDFHNRPGSRRHAGIFPPIGLQTCPQQFEECLNLAFAKPDRDQPGRWIPTKILLHRLWFDSGGAVTRGNRTYGPRLQRREQHRSKKRRFPNGQKYSLRRNTFATSRRGRNLGPQVQTWSCSGQFPQSAGSDRSFVNPLPIC